MTGALPFEQGLENEYIPGMRMFEKRDILDRYSTRASDEYVPDDRG
jgi:hypothetical protein